MNLSDLEFIKWEYEDELPEMYDEQYDEMFAVSKVISGVRMFPYVNLMPYGRLYINKHNVFEVEK